MEPLPYVDEHRRQIRATVERTFDAVVRFAQTRLARPAPAAFVALWQLQPTSGFAVAERNAPGRLVLRGRHRFSHYELAFDIEPSAGGAVVIARTSAVFPGLAGQAYRALVISSGGHGVAVRWLLNRIATSAERPA